jgi:hypothetical protein
MGVLSKDWRVVFLYPWWLIAALCLAVGIASTFLVGRYWLLPKYLLYLIEGG